MPSRLPVTMHLRDTDDDDDGASLPASWRKRSSLILGMTPASIAVPYRCKVSINNKSSMEHLKY